MDACNTKGLDVPIVATVYGVGDNKALLTRYDARGVTTKKIPIEWGEKSKLQCWSLSYLKEVQAAAMEMLEGKPGIITGAMPGADLALTSLDGKIVAPLLHYRAVMESGIFEDVMKRMDDKWEIFQALGGANVAGFQSIFQLALYEQTWKEPFRAAKRMMTLADWLTWSMTGVFARDPVMARCQGLDSYEALRLITRVTGPNMVNLFGPPEDLEGQESLLLTMPNDMGFMMPFTHDSTWARMVINTPWKLWTGGWCGWTCDVKGLGGELDLERIFKAGGAIEGVGDTQAVIGNTAMIGPVYDELRARTKKSFLDFARLIGPYMPYQAGPLIDLKEIPTDEKEAANKLRNIYGTEVKAAAALIESAAQTFQVSLAKAAGVLGQVMPREAGIFGGWAENIRFKEALDFYDIKTVAAPFATKSTEDTVAAEAYRRYVIKMGLKPITFRESLEIIHGVRALTSE